MPVLSKNTAILGYSACTNKVTDQRSAAAASDFCPQERYLKLYFHILYECVIDSSFHDIHCWEWDLSIEEISMILLLLYL